MMAITKAISDVKGGKISFRVDKASNLHAILGKASFDAEKIAEKFDVHNTIVLYAAPMPVPHTRPTVITAQRCSQRRR